jgi:hypothetical protein
MVFGVLVVIALKPASWLQDRSLPGAVRPAPDHTTARALRVARVFPSRRSGGLCPAVAKAPASLAISGWLSDPWAV